MSQTQFVRYRQNGFWAYDVALGVFLKHLIDVADEQSLEQERWLTDEVRRWRVVATANSYGLELGADWSPRQVATFVRLAREACVRVSRRESFRATEIEAWSVLEGKGFFARGANEVFTRPIVELGEAIVSLAEGKVVAAPDGTAWLYGTPSGRCTIALRPVSE